MCAPRRRFVLDHHIGQLTHERGPVFDHVDKLEAHIRELNDELVREFAEKKESDRDAALKEAKLEGALGDVHKLRCAVLLLLLSLLLLLLLHAAAAASAASAAAAAATQGCGRVMAARARVQGVCAGQGAADRGVPERPRGALAHGRKVAGAGREAAVRQRPRWRHVLT